MFYKQPILRHNFKNTIKMKAPFKMPLKAVTLIAALFVMTLSTFAQQPDIGDAILGKWINEGKDRTIEFVKEGNEYIAVIVVAEDKTLIGKKQITDLLWDGKAYKEGKLHAIKKDKSFPCSVVIKTETAIEISVKMRFMSGSRTWTKVE
jgi:hypothetical protein